MHGPRLVLVCGTGTEVGKTWVAARVAEGLRGMGVRVSARKPVQSFEAGWGSEAPADLLLDSEILAEATGEDPFEVCPQHRSIPVAMAPPMAAAKLGWPEFTVGDLISELQIPAGTEVGLIETAGGVFSPQAIDGDVVSIIDNLMPDLVLLVADAGLGTINSVRGASAALAGSAPTVFLNRFDASDELHLANEEWLRDRCGLDVCVSIGGLLERIVEHGAGRVAEAGGGGP